MIFTSLIHFFLKLIVHSNTISNNRVLAGVFVSAKAKLPNAWTCEAYVKLRKIVCAQSDAKNGRHVSKAKKIEATTPKIPWNVHVL